MFTGDHSQEQEDELLDWLCNVYASANDALPTVDLTQINVTLQNNQITGMEWNGNDQQFGTPHHSSDAE